MGKGPGWEALLAVVLVECVGPEALVIGTDVGVKVEEVDADDDEEEEDEVENVNVCEEEEEEEEGVVDSVAVG